MGDFSGVLMPFVVECERARERTLLLIGSGSGSLNIREEESRRGSLVSEELVDSRTYPSKDNENIFLSS